MQHQGFKIFALITIIGSFLSSSLLAEESIQWVACKKMKSLGLFEQCESVKVFKRVGKRVRAYSFKNKRLLNIPASRVFEVRAFDRSVKAQRILIPGNLLWGGSSSKQVSSICEPTETNTGTHIKLNCGKSEHQSVNPKFVQSLGKSYDEHFPLQPRQPDIIQSKSADKSKG